MAGVAVLAVALGGCGADSPDGAKALAGLKGLDAYVPAAQSCPEAPPAAPGGIRARVSGYRVCGPFVAAPGASSFDCPLRDGSKGPYRLLLTNGGADGSGRASSARVTVNGVEVLGPQAFDQQTRAATARVALGSVNRIDAQVQGPSGSVRLEVVDEAQTCSILGARDVTASGLKASFSSANARPEPELQLFNGGADGAAPTNKGEVSLDGKALVARSDLREKVTAILAPVKLGARSTLTAIAGNKGLFTVQVVDRDATPPGLGLVAPRELSFTNQPQLAVTGTVDDPSAVVTVDGVPAATGGGAFSGKATLAGCWNTIVVAASDACGNRSEATVRVGLDTAAPVVGIVSPPNGLVTNRATLPVGIRYTDDFSGVDPSSLRALLDGVDVTASFTIGADAAGAQLPSTSGEHVLEVRVSDRAGNAGVAKSAFRVDLEPPQLAIVSPAGGTVSSPVPVTITYADPGSGVDLSSLVVTLDGRAVTSSLGVGPVSAAAALEMAPGEHRLEARIADLAGNVAAARVDFTVAAGNAIPPDPASVAPRTTPRS